MNELTGTTKRVFDFLLTCAAHGDSPTVRDIQDGLFLSSSSVAYHHLKKLAHAGYIARSPGYIHRSGRLRRITILKGHAGDVVMVFRGEDAELVREQLGSDPARQLLNILKTERAVDKAG